MCGLGGGDVAILVEVSFGDDQSLDLLLLTVPTRPNCLAKTLFPNLVLRKVLATVTVTLGVIMNVLNVTTRELPRLWARPVAKGLEYMVVWTLCIPPVETETLTFAL